ncbi:MAG: VCBS repeat-containing protein [Ignavibacteriales bacterium]|nr:VCBS repeat-containing protein [Ignavibacteriales bacterium]
MIKKIFTVLLISTCTLLGQHVWTQNSFKDFSKGTFSDAGANMYVSHNGRIQAINRWDVNNDGNVDILCVNSHSLVEKLDMSIYWGNGKDFSIQNHSYIPANGPMWATANDLDNDGNMDLVVPNYSNGTWTNMDSFIYYGGLDKNYKKKKGEWAFYPFKKRVSLKSSSAQKAAVGDFNKDGYKDIVFAFSSGFWEYRDKNKKGSSNSRIYWGGKDGYSNEHFTDIATDGATDVVTSDLNNDGWLDLVFANSEGKTSYIYYGGKDGYNENNFVELPTDKASSVKVADVDNNGTQDLVFACEDSFASYAYTNIDGKFDSNRRIVFETYDAKDVVAADFNKDGFTDLFFTNHQYSLSGDPNLASRLIDSYLYFGSSNGFSNKNRQSIPTIGAWGANAADLNNDGWIDLLVCNNQEQYSYEVPSFIYWNGPEGFKETKRTPLYEHGAEGNSIADFNNDGYPDILITSMMGNSRGDYDPSYLYFGKSDGSFDEKHRIELPGREAYEQAFADLNDDGKVDVLMVNRGETNRVANEVYIYWNNENKFSTWDMSGLPSYNGLGVQVADLDRNGYLDIIVSNGGAPVNMPDKVTDGSFIYWGSDKGWPVEDRTVLPIELTRAATVCDINNDSFLDLVFGNQKKGGLATIFYGDGTRNYSIKNSVQLQNSQGSGMAGVADLNKDGLLDLAFAHDKNVLIYYQDKNHKFGLPILIPVQAKTMTIGDVNNDGWLDLACPFYSGNGKRSWYSTVLLGSKNGFSINNVLKFPTDGGTGALICDFNHDGFNDIFFYCHRADGSYDEINDYSDHHTNSLLYWGSPNGFSDKNVLKIPSVGAHYNMGVDVGNISDRKNTYSYFSSTYNSDNSKPVSINWQAETPSKTSIKFQLRSADSEKDLAGAEWRGPSGINSYYTTQNKQIKNISGKWLQYRAVFNMDNGADTPVLKSVEIKFKN